MADMDTVRMDRGGATAAAGLLSLGVGIVPCTGAVLVLLYAIANDILLAGYAMVVAISLGMALTLAALGLASIVARRFVAARLTGPTGGRRWAAAALDYGGAAAIVLIGTALLLTELLGGTTIAPG